MRWACIGRALRIWSRWWNPAASVKISGAYRASTQPDHAGVKPLAQALIAANVDRIVWGSHWPHPHTH